MNFFSRYKKIFILLGFIAVCLLLGILIWKTFFSGEVSLLPGQSSPTGGGSALPGAQPGSGQIVEGGPTTVPGSNNIAGQNEGVNTGVRPSVPGRGSESISNSAQGGLTKTQAVTSEPVLNPVSAKNGNGVQYYNQADGKFYRLDANGEVKTLSDQVFHNVENVVWAPDPQKAIIEYPDGSKILYNFSTNKQATLPKHWEDFSFSPDSNQISAKSLALDAENRYLITANEDGSKAKAVEYIGTNDKDVQVNWSPNNQVVATYNKGLDFDRKEVFFVSANGENMKSMVVEGRGFTSKWSTTGEKILYSVYSSSDGLRPRLWIASAQGEAIGANRRSLDLSTWSDKCTFASNDRLYCAVPKNLPKGAGLFPEVADQTNDELYQIDLSTGAQKKIAVPDGNYNISQIIIPENNNALYFTDKNTGKLYKINL